MAVTPLPPRLVLVHGTRMDQAEWAAYPALLPEAEVVAVDLPGHGARLHEEFTAEAAIAVIREAVTGRAPGQRVVLAGHSLGGYLATLYAVRVPGELAALVLIGATAEPTGPFAAMYRGFADLLPRVGAARMARASNAVMRRLGAGEGVLTGPETYAALPAAWQVVFDQCRAELLAEVDCPVFVVNGQLDQMRVHAGRFAAAARDAHVITVPRATHLLPVTHPEQVAVVLREALNATPEARWRVEVWLDPSCPLTRHTVLWLRVVGHRVPLEFRWRVMSLSVLNEHRDDDPEGDPEGYLWIPARIAAAVEAAHGSAALRDFYEALWTTPEGDEIAPSDGEEPEADDSDVEDTEATDTDALDTDTTDTDTTDTDATDDWPGDDWPGDDWPGDDWPGDDWLGGFREALSRCGLPTELAEAGKTTDHDERLRASHREGVDLIEAEVGTPILRLTAPDGRTRAFFGPVLATVPGEDESLAVWQALTTLVGAPAFRELKA